MADAVSYTAVLPVAGGRVLFVSRLLAVERRRRGTRSGRRALGCYRQAVLVLRWFVDGTRLAQLAADNRIGRSMAYGRCTRASMCWPPRHPGCAGRCWALLPGQAHLHVDGTLIRTGRCSVLGPTTRADRPERRVDLWWSGKHAAHRGNIQVVTAPDNWPLWTSEVRPGRAHDTAARRARRC